MRAIDIQEVRELISRHYGAALDRAERDAINELDNLNIAFECLIAEKAFEVEDETYMTDDEYAGANETSIAEEFPFGFCPQCNEPIEIDYEELQQTAYEAWEQIEEMAMEKVNKVKGFGPEADKKRREAAQKNGLPLWCEACGEPVDDLFLFNQSEENEE